MQDPNEFNDWEGQGPPMSDHEKRAWELYCKETAGSADARDFWDDLPPKVRDLYLRKTMTEKEIMRAEQVRREFGAGARVVPPYKPNRKQRLAQEKARKLQARALAKAKNKDKK